MTPFRAMPRRLALVLAVFSFVAIGAAAAPTSQPVVVMSYNIHHGEGTDGEIDLPRIARVIRSAAPDLVALQEVDRNTRRSGGVDQAAELARLTGMKQVFGRTIDYAGGRYGNAVLSRLPIGAIENHRLPHTEGREPRAVLAVEILASPSGEDRTVLFLATHFDHTHDSTDRLAAARAIVKLARTAPDRPMLLAGDLNATPDSAPLKILTAVWQIAGAGRELPTVPVARPTRRIDYVLFRPPERWRVVDVRVLDEAVASDHRPVVASLRFLPRP